MLQCIKLNEVSVQVTLVPASPPPTLPLFTAGNQGRGPLPAGVVPARLHKLALMEAGETCSKGGSEGQKATKAKRKGEARVAARRRTGDPPKVTFLCRPIVSLLRLAARSEARLLVPPPTSARRGVGERNSGCRGAAAE